MNTLFTVTRDKGTDAEQGYTIDLGIDILEGMTEGDIYKCAAQSKVITLQGRIRSSKDTVKDFLDKAGYATATVTEGIERKQSSNALYNALVKKYGKENVESKLAEMGLEL